MKKVFSIVFVLFMALGLTACGETTEEKAVNNLIEKVGENADDQTKALIKDAINNSEELQQELVGEMAQIGLIAKVAKVYHACLVEADDKGDAIECYEDADKLADKIGIIEEDDEFNPDEEFGDWTPEEKSQLLAEMEAGLKFFEERTQ